VSRHRFAVFALISISLASSLWFLLDVITAYTYLRDTYAFGVPNFDSRFQTLRKSMPARSVVGYVSDNPANNTQSQAEFYLTQYALAPAIVKATTEEHFVVANFHTNSPDPAMLRAKRLVLVQDFGNDVFIYRNITR
jgi:accessory gene regulator protein AgrB